MSKKANLTPVEDTRVNSNLERINTQFENTLSLDGSMPNAMNADLDMNSNDVLNVDVVGAQEVIIKGVPFRETVIEATQDIEDAKNLAQAWAESPTPPDGPGTKSSKTWAGEAELDRIQTNQDRANTGQDAIATAADRVQTGLDTVATDADRTQTGLDRVATGQDAVATNADKVQTGLDRVQTGSDRTAAGTSASDALGYRNTTLLYRNAAEGFRDTASSKAVEAAGSASTATNQAGLAQGSASDAADSAIEAEGYKDDANAYLQLFNDTTASANTLAAGASATASYNPATGELSLGIPQGIKGDQGDAFQVDAVGTTAERSGYDSQPAGFSFLDTDVGALFIRQGASGWSPAIPFGKGDKGDKGDDGNGFTPAQISKLDGIATGATKNATDAQLRARGSHTGTQLAATISDFQSTVSANADVDAAKTKLTGIAIGATKNATDAALRDRASHTGTQAISTIVGLQAGLDSAAKKASNLSDLANAATARTNLGLGTAATTASTAYATAAQGLKADAALPKADKATTGEAQTGTDDTKYMTALKVKQSINHNSPTPPDPDVMGIIAGAGAGAVGTYAFAQRSAGSGGLATGATTAGSNLKTANGGGSDGVNSGPLTGTWRNMGSFFSNSSDARSEAHTTLFLRIS